MIDKDRLEAMSKLGIAASKAGESLRKVMLAMKQLQKYNPPYKQWQSPYKYHK